MFHVLVLCVRVCVYVGLVVKSDDMWLSGMFLEYCLSAETAARYLLFSMSHTFIHIVHMWFYFPFFQRVPLNLYIRL